MGCGLRVEEVAGLWHEGSRVWLGRWVLAGLRGEVLVGVLVCVASEAFACSRRAFFLARSLVLRFFMAAFDLVRDPVDLLPVEGALGECGSLVDWVPGRLPLLSLGCFRV